MAERRACAALLPCLQLSPPCHSSDPLPRHPVHPPQELLAAALSPSPGLAAGAAANSLVYAAGIHVLLSGLTWPGVASSWVLGTLTYAAFGAGGYAIVCAYFIAGSLVRGRREGGAGADERCLRGQRWRWGSVGRPAGQGAPPLLPFACPHASHSLPARALSDPSPSDLLLN